MQPVGWGDCADILGNDELQGVKMPNGPGVDRPVAGASLQYNEVRIRLSASIAPNANVADSHLSAQVYRL